MKINIECEPEDIGALLLSVVKSADDANRTLWRRLRSGRTPAPIHIDPDSLNLPTEVTNDNHIYAPKGETK